MHISTVPRPVNAETPGAVFLLCQPLLVQVRQQYLLMSLLCSCASLSSAKLKSCKRQPAAWAQLGDCKTAFFFPASNLCNVHEITTMPTCTPTSSRVDPAQRNKRKVQNEQIRLTANKTKPVYTKEVFGKCKGRTNKGVKTVLRQQQQLGFTATDHLFTQPIGVQGAGPSSESLALCEGEYSVLRHCAMLANRRSAMAAVRSRIVCANSGLSITQRLLSSLHWKRGMNNVVDRHRQRMRGKVLCPKMRAWVRHEGTRTPY